MGIYEMYERICKFSYKLLKLRCPLFLRKKLERPIFLASMNLTPDEIYSCFLLSFLFSFLIFLLLSLVDFPTLLILLIFPFFIAYNILTFPQFYADIIRIRAGSEGVSIIIYMVTYLALNPVFEKAFEYAAQHSHGPLGRDFKRIMWEVKTNKYPTLKDAIAVYSEKWTFWNEDFVNSLILLQLVETQPTREKINDILTAAIDRIMTSTLKKMEKYALDLKTPSLMLLLFGITLPLMGLVMFPLISIFLTTSINPIYIAIGYIVILPFFLGWFLYRMISKRPGTYSNIERLEEVEVREHINFLGLKFPIVPLGILIGFLIMIPGLMHYYDLTTTYLRIFSVYPYEKAIEVWGKYCLERYGPDHILFDAAIAMTVPFGIALSIFFITFFRSSKPYKLDKFVRNLENEFIDGLFELHSALASNLPIETALGKVVEYYERINRKNSPIAIFFARLRELLVRSPITFQQLLFGKKGILKEIPSSMIKSIMEIINSALTKGPLIASNVIKNIVNYLKRLREIEHLMVRFMKDVLSNLEMTKKFISPFIAGIVAAASVIVIQILQALANILHQIELLYGSGTNIGGSLYDTLGLIKLEQVVPPTFMELVAGVYLIEVVIITSILSSGIHRGFSKVYRDYSISRSIMFSFVLFMIIFFLMVFLFQPVIQQIIKQG